LLHTSAPGAELLPGLTIESRVITAAAQRVLQQFGDSAAWRPAIQTGIAAGLAWWIAADLLGHDAPLAAPIVATVAIGAAPVQRLGRTLEVVAGVSIGVGFAAVAAAELGVGPAQLGVVVALAMLGAALLGDRDLLTVQAGLTVILVFVSAGATAGDAMDRVAEALVGGACALAVSLFVLPPDPLRMLQRKQRALSDELGNVLRDVAAGLEDAESDAAVAALDRARATDELVAELRSASLVAVEIARFVPSRRSVRGRVARGVAAVPHLDHAARNARVIARTALDPGLHAEGISRASAQVATLLSQAFQCLTCTDVRADRSAVDLARTAAERARALSNHLASPGAGALATAALGVAEDLAAATGS
jgi:uncharacterized membrane protein YgaE (UPF0421/DUF939 family)